MSGQLRRHLRNCIATYERLSRQGRPVEITHPDLVQTGPHHGLDSYDIMLTRHDLMHCWLSGSNFKEFVRYERQLLSHKGVCQRSGMLMSKAIWVTTDMAYKVGLALRGAKENLATAFVKSMLQVILESGGNRQHIWALNFIDMIKQPDKWNEFVRKFDPTETRSFMEIVLKLDGDPAFQDFVSMCQEDVFVELIRDNPSKPNEYFILWYALGFVPAGLEWLDKLSEDDFKALFYWGADDHLHVKKEHLEKICDELLMVEGDIIVTGGDLDLVTGVLRVAVQEILQKELGKSPRP